MDGLALLCNLFADGPVTLARLRAARIAGLDELARVAPAELADWLRSSVPQACAFAAEARKLEARLGRERGAARAEIGVRSDSAVRADQLVPRAPVAERFASASDVLRPGLVAGLDEHVCARLRAHGVRTPQALVESAGLALARRTGIPYSTLLELARAVRRAAASGATAVSPARSPEIEVAEVELVPPAPRRTIAPWRTLSPRAAAMPDPVRSDEFTLPLVEPEAAGPFG